MKAWRQVIIFSMATTSVAILKIQLFLPGIKIVYSRCSSSNVFYKGLIVRPVSIWPIVAPSVQSWIRRKLGPIRLVPNFWLALALHKTTTRASFDQSPHVPAIEFQGPMSLFQAGPDPKSKAQHSPKNAIPFQLYRSFEHNRSFEKHRRDNFVSKTFRACFSETQMLPEAISSNDLKH